MKKTVAFFLTFLTTSAMAEYDALVALADFYNNKYTLTFENNQAILQSENDLGRGKPDKFFLNTNCLATTPDGEIAGMWGYDYETLWITDAKPVVKLTHSDEDGYEIMAEYLSVSGRSACTEQPILKRMSKGTCSIELLGRHILDAEVCAIAIYNDQIRVAHKDAMIVTIDLKERKDTGNILATIKSTHFNPNIAQHDFNIEFSNLKFNDGCWVNSAGKICAHPNY